MHVAEKQIIHPLLKEPLPGIVHGSVSRFGGESVGPFTSNNISYGVGDDASCVTRNRENIKKRFGLDYLVSAHQVHGKNIHMVEGPLRHDCIFDDTDALMTNVVGVGLMIGHADCQAVLLYDRNRRAVAAVHNGWRGSVVNIVAATIEAMRNAYGTVPEQLIAGIGPSLGPCCAEFVHYEKELPRSFQDFRVGENHFDFWEITRIQLQQCGVPGESISCIETCTVCTSAFFSYRRACRKTQGITGRNGSLIALV
jgi:polyphenol oxidase